MSVCILNKAPARVNQSAAEEISQALCASALETQSRGRSQRGWEASAAVTCNYVTHERVSPSGLHAHSPTIPPLLLLCADGSSSLQRRLSRFFLWSAPPGRGVVLALTWLEWVSICANKLFLAAGGCFRCVRNESSKLPECSNYKFKCKSVLQPQEQAHFNQIFTFNYVAVYQLFFFFYY